MKRSINTLLVTILLIFFTLSFQITSQKSKFNINNVYTNIEILSSNQYKGRPTGTLENLQAEIFIKNKFINLGFEPFEETYLHKFDVVYPKQIEGTPYLIVKDKNNNIIKKYKYALDFKEDMINFKNNNFSFNNNSLVLFDDNMCQIDYNGDLFLLYVPGDKDLTFRSSFNKDFKYSMCVMITNNTYKEIRYFNAMGYKIECFIPEVNEKTKVHNIISTIKGKNSNLSPIIICAHFDHLGTDLSGTIYSGALDNASGVAFIIELGSYIKSLGKPERDILIAAFNGEELGFRGSEAFVKQHKEILKDSKVYNFDMIGSKISSPLYIIGSQKDSSNTSFLKSISITCNQEKISYGFLYEDCSDHISFRINNIDAVTLSDNDMTNIHTPKDTIDNISIDSLERCFKMVNKQIVHDAFSDSPLILYNDKILLISLFLLLISIYTKREFL